MKFMYARLSVSAWFNSASMRVFVMVLMFMDLYKCVLYIV